MTVPLERQKNIADVKARVREQLGLGSAALSDQSDFATAAQGGLADTSVQPNELLGINKASTKNPYFRRIQKIVPLCGGSYSTIISTYGHDYLVPQGVRISLTDKLIYVLYGASNPDTTIYVFVWSFTDWENPHDVSYVTCFRCATGTGFSAESIVVRREGGSRYAYLRLADSTIRRYDITTMPADLALLAPSTALLSNAYSQIDFKDGEWVVMQPAVSLGQQTRRGHFARYSSDLTTRKGTVQFNVEDVGPWTQSAFEQSFPKIQGIAIGEGFFALQLGGKFNAGDTATPYQFQGLKLAKANGGIFLEAALDPAKTMGLMASAGLQTPTTIEGEGICIAEDAEIYSLSYYLSSTPTGAPANVAEGIAIFKEFSTDEDAIDFSSAAITFPGFDRSKFSLGHFPRSPQGAFNPITGAAFSTLEQICDYMLSSDAPRFEFYSTTFSSILDPSGAAIPTGIYVQILNANNVTFPVIYHQAAGNSGVIRGGIISGTAGSRTMQMQPWTREGITALADVNGSLTVGTSTRHNTFATLTADRTISLSLVGATAGSVFELRRSGGAFNAIIQNGVGGSTIDTMAANAYSKFVFDGTNWVKFSA